MSFLTLRKDTQKVVVGGIDQPEADLMCITDGYLAIKVPGHTYQWGSFSGDRSYAPVEIQVYEIKSRQDLGEIDRIEAVRILYFPINKKKEK